MQLADVRRRALDWLRPDGRLSWLRTALALEALVVLVSAVLFAAGLDLWGFAMVGVLCALITHVAFLRPGVRVVSLWGALSFVVTVGAGARGLIIALDYPSRAANNAMFLRGHSFASLVPEAVFTVVGVLAVTYGYLRGRAGESDGPARLDRRWLMPVGRMSDKVMGFTVGRRTMSPTGRRPMSRTPGSSPCCSTSPGGCRTTAGCARWRSASRGYWPSTPSASTG